MISFTICSNNYIHKAQVLANSIQKLSGTPIYLFLADLNDSKISYSQLNFNKVIFLEELNIPNLQWMKEHYSIVELNTAIKPFAFSYLLRHTDAADFFYFDPDMCLFQPLTAFEPLWKDATILLTPHILSPIPFDGKFPGENLFLNHGIYNLGFLGLKRGAVTEKLLGWWSERSLEYCKIDLSEGYFVDQLWFNLVPGLFGSTTITPHPGCNMSYWNLHERMLSLVAGNYVVNTTEPLIFYHFSSFDAEVNHIHYKKDIRYSFADQGALKTLYKEYAAALDNFSQEFYQGFSYFNGQYPLVAPKPTILKRILRKVKSLRK